MGCKYFVFYGGERLQTIFLIAIAIYLLVLLGLSLWAKGQIEDESDFLVAKRRLPMFLASGTLLATWFGAGTLLTATDEVRLSGLSVTSLEPYGAGCCLLIAGFFFAKPLWEMNILTLADFYRIRFGKKAEVLSVILTIPGFVGWIAVQMVACGEILRLIFEISLPTGILLVAILATLYTLIGGMWSVTLTDAFQMSLIVFGVCAISFQVFASFGGGSPWLGLGNLWSSSHPDDLVVVPYHKLPSLLTWTNVFIIAALGNLPSQDLAQRIFSCRSAKVAQRACIFAGVAYLLIGTLPVLVGLAAKQLLPASVQSAVLPALAKQFMSPTMMVLFILALLSVVLSTIDSAILATASTLANNVFRKFLPPSISSLRICQVCVIGVSVLSLLVAYSGEDAYFLLESAYASTLVALFVPLLAGLYFKKRYESSAVWSMILGLGVWSLEFFLDLEFPMALVAVTVSLFTYQVHARWLALRPTAEAAALEGGLSQQSQS